MRVYHRNDDGTITWEYWSGSKQDYLEQLSIGMPAEFARQKTGEEDLLGWPNRRVEWYGNVGFPIRQ